MEKMLDLGDYEEIDEEISKHISRNKEIDLGEDLEIE